MVSRSYILDLKSFSFHHFPLAASHWHPQEVVHIQVQVPSAHSPLLVQGWIAPKRIYVVDQISFRKMKSYQEPKSAIEPFIHEGW